MEIISVYSNCTFIENIIWKFTIITIKKFNTCYKNGLFVIIKNFGKSLGQQGYTKCSCFLCERNIKNLIPSMHIKLSIIKQFVKTFDENDLCFQYLRTK